MLRMLSIGGVVLGCLCCGSPALGDQPVEKQPAAAKEGEKQDIQARMDHAEQLARERKWEEAAGEYVWLWKNMLQHQPSTYGVRLSFMVDDMKELARASKEARKRFTELRDEAGKALEKEKVAVDDVVDWVALNRVLNNGAATLKWYDKVKGEARWKGLVSRVSRDLAVLFVESRRWADVGRLYADPVAELEREHSHVTNAPPVALPKELNEEMRRQIKDIPARLFREKTSRIYAGLLAAGRDREAQKFVARAYELEKDARVIKAYVELALDIGEPRAEQIRLIEGVNDPAVPLGELKARVEASLKKKEAT